MNNPVTILPEAMKAMLSLGASTKDSDVPQKLFKMIHLRASQINGCGFCADMHARELKQAGESDERIWAISAWFDAPYFTDAERAVLALTEAATRLADRTDAVPDSVWNEARKHFDEKALAAIIIHIAVINAWNRINVTTRTVAGSWKG
jgi:AhpD family alkylhydroperoxidase